MRGRRHSFTWIIGKTEARLMSLIDGRGVYHRRQALRSSRRGASCDAQLRGRQFDVLLHMQLALRASLHGPHGARARIKLGFDRARARELQWLFTNARIAPRTREHVLDSFFGFTEALGIRERLLRWDLPLPAGRAGLRRSS